MDDNGVFAMHHEDLFFELDAIDLVEPDRKWIKPKGSQIPKSLRMYFVWILIGGQLVGGPVDENSLFELRQRRDAPERGLGRRREDPVVSARVCPGDRSRGEAANTIRLEPFT